MVFVFIGLSRQYNNCFWPLSFSCFISGKAFCSVVLLSLLFFYRMTFRLMPLCFLFALLSCSRSQDPLSPGNEPQSLAQLDWLCGEWAFEHADGSLSTERWEKVSDTLLAGEGLSVLNKDTLFRERITIALKKGKLIYTPAVSGQNGNLPVPFVLTQAESSVYSFENPSHDFPQRIVYSHPHPDSLIAWIEGKLDGKMKRVDFRFGKIN
jgi:hypothetical protein